MEDVTGALEAVDGTVLFTRRWRANPPRAVVLIVHGLGEHSGRYGHVGGFFADRGLETVAFDLRGHGRSGGSRVDIDDFTTYLQDLAKVIDTEVVPMDLPWVLYGHSMGGLIGALHLEGTERQPTAAVLSAPALDADVPPPLKIAAEVFGRVAPGLRFPNSINGEQLSRDPRVGEAYFADPLVETKTTARFGRGLFAAQRRAREAIDAIALPTLVVHGAEDELVPPSASAPLAAVEGIERKLLPGLRHEVHNEPEHLEVLRDVAAWIDAALDQTSP